MSSKSDKSSSVNKSQRTWVSHTSYVASKALTKNSKWPDKEEFLDVIYWGRQVLGLVLGLVWGIIPLKGIVGLVLFCLASAIVVYYYAFTYQCVDEDEFGGAWEITKEGFVTSFAGFLVMWIIIYSGLHFDD